MRARGECPWRVRTPALFARLPLLAEPAERATQFRRAVSVVGASVGHDHLLGLPGDHLLQGGAALLLAAQERQPDFGGGLAVGVHDTAQPHQPRVEEAHLIRLEVLDVIRQYKGARLAVEEDDLLHEAAAAEDELVEVPAPCLFGLVYEVPIEA